MSTDEQSVTVLAQAKQRRSLGKQLGLRRGDALLVLDVQRDFFTGGALAIANGEDVIAPINAYIAAFDERRLPIYFTRNWHPHGHCSFKQAGGHWPPHCIQGTHGAAWADGLTVPESARVISKGIESDAPGLSAFAGTQLLKLLADAKVRRVFVAGVATDHCVHATVLGARSNRFDVVVLGDAIRGLNREHGDESRALREMMECGATFFERSTGASPQARFNVGQRRKIYAIGNYGFGIETTAPFDEAIVRVTQALQNEGFGVITDIDVAATMQKKLGAYLPPYRILGACNPALAHRALQAQPAVGLLLPCNVVVRQQDDGRIRIEFMDPHVLSEMIDDEQVADVARHVRRKLRQAIDWI